MGFFSDFGRSLLGQSSSQSSPTVPSWLKGPAKDLVSQASSYALGNTQYPGFTPFQTQALQKQGEMASQGSDLYSGARDEFMKTVTGGYLGGNPYLESQIDASLGDLRRNYSMTTKPQTEAAMVRSGSFGNSGLGQMQREQERNLMDVMGRTASGMRFNNYANERQNQVNAINQAPTFDAARYADVDRLFGAGATQQQQAVNELQFPMQQYQSLASLLNPMIGSMSGTRQTGMSPQSSQQGLGNLLNVGAMLLSDRRAKEDIKKVGKTDGGLNVYTYKYKGIPGVHMGVMAQEAKKKNPDSVGQIGGLLAVDYSKVQ